MGQGGHRTEIHPEQAGLTGLRAPEFAVLPWRRDNKRAGQRFLTAYPDGLPGIPPFLRQRIRRRQTVIAPKSEPLIVIRVAQNLDLDDPLAAKPLNSLPHKRASYATFLMIRGHTERPQ